MIYNKQVEHCFFYPEHVGTLDTSQPEVGAIHKGIVSLGARFDLYIHCDGTGHIRRACFKAYGNPYLLACMEWVCRQLEDSCLEEHPRVDTETLMELFEIPKSSSPVVLMLQTAYCELVGHMKLRLKGENHE